MKDNLLFLTLLFILSFAGCDKKESAITSLTMLQGGKTFAVPTGTVADQFVLEKFPDAKIKYFNTILDCAIAVKADKADAAVYDEPVLKNIAAKIEGLIVLKELLIDDNFGYAVQLQNMELKTAIDEVLAEIKADGTYDDMMKRWFPDHGNPAPMPIIELNGTNGILVFGTAAIAEPMAFVDASQNVVGFDIEFVKYVAKKLGKQLEIVDMEFGAMLPALISGKVDMIGAAISITEERAKKVLFSESYYPSGIAAIVKGKTPIDRAGPDDKMSDVDDIKDKRMGVLLGSVHDSYVNKNHPDARVFQYQSPSDMLIALATEKVDLAWYDHYGLKEILSKNPDIVILAENIFYADIAAGFNQDTDDLRERFNAFLREIKANGIHDEMISRWMIQSISDMPVIHSSEDNGVLRVGIVNDLGMPSSFIKDGEVVGFNIEIAARFASYLGKELVLVPYQFNGLLAAVSTHKIDVIIASMMITEEREKQIDFSDPYHASGATIIALKKNLTGHAKEAEGLATEEESFKKGLFRSFHSNLWHEKRYLLIVDGLKVTIIITILSALLGTILGGLVCSMRMSQRKMLSASAGIFITLIRGTPTLVLLMIIFYVVFASVNIDPVIVAVIAFGINFGAYVSEMFRTSIESVDKGQREAGIASGFTKVQTFIHIISPQALRRVLPVYKGELISMMKMTSIVGYIAVQDLTKASDIIRSRTFDAFFPLIMAAVIYLILAWLLTWGLSRVEISVDPKRKRIKKVKEGAV